MELMIVWLLFAIATMCLAIRKHRSAVAWALLGFFFGAFAFVAILCLPKKEEAKPITNVINVYGTEETCNDEPQLSQK